MTILTGLLILLAVLIAAGLAVLGAIASAAEIVPSWFDRGGETLNTTALVHEAWMRLVGGEAKFESRAHFFADEIQFAALYSAGYNETPRKF